jgi:hypothetical protein
MNIIWQYLDKRGAAINALKDYKSMEYIIKHTDEEIANIHDDLTTIGSPAFSDMPSGTHNPQSGEIRMAVAIDEIDVLRERYRQAKEYMEWFQPAWKTLNSEERFVLEQFYWEEETKQIDAVYNICDQLHVERSTAYNKKNRAVQHLALLLYGK